MPRRAVARSHHRPIVETLEIRTLLSSSTTTSFGPQSPAFGPVQSAGSSGGSSSTYYDSLIGSSAARAQYHVDGTGMTVAVIDAGVNYDNEALGGGFGTGQKVVAGYDFADNSSDPNATGLQHGTAVAGLIASDDPSDEGVAPGADIAALKVFDNNNQSSFRYVAQALQWVIDNHAKYNITTVNISLSDGLNYTQNWFAHDGGVGQQVTELISQLDTMNIPVITATGNSFSGAQGAGFTGIVADSISVTATNASDQFVASAQRLGASLGGASATKIAAPGDGLTAPGSGTNGLASVTGTSFAAPLVTGAVVLMQQVYRQRFGSLPTVQQLDTWLQQGSDPINDPVTGITIGRLDIPKAIAAIPNPATQVLTPPTSSNSSGGGSGQTSTGGTAGTSGGMQLWVNGQPVSSTDLQNGTGSASTLSATLLKGLNSLQGWASSGSNAQVWVAGKLTEPQTAGVVKTIAIHPKVAQTSGTSVMPRAWQTFAAKKKTG
jgi:subtilisin family serine protease